MYQIEFDKSFDKKYFLKIPNEYQRKIKEFIEIRLSNDPFSAGKLLKGNFEGLRSARIGIYRIIYEIFDDKITVYIIKIAHRKDVYE